MSKSKGNVVNPDDLVREYGTDSVRLYELFIGPPEEGSEWNDNGIEGMYRFLRRAWHWVLDTAPQAGEVTAPAIEQQLHIMLKQSRSSGKFSLQHGHQRHDGVSQLVLYSRSTPSSP